MGSKYTAVAPQTVQILFQAPSWPAEQIGVVTSQGAQLASDASVYQELQHKRKMPVVIELKICAEQDDSLGVILPEEALNRLGLHEGDSALLTEAPGGGYLLLPPPLEPREV
jgi:hypothetical protein